MNQPRLLDLFCGAGGAALGYMRAGFEVVGVDNDPKVGALYPGTFILADAMTYPLDGFNAVHASPPCHAHCALNSINRIDYGTGWMLAATRDRLIESGIPWVVENVPTARMSNPLRLCGTEFGLRTEWPPHGTVWLRRHRLFDSSQLLFGAGGCHCAGRKVLGVYGGGPGGKRVRFKGPGAAQAQRELMGIDWMPREQLDEAIPPVYTEHIGRQLLAATSGAV